MTNTALVQIKVDTETKTYVISIYESLGLDVPTAVRIFFFKKSIAVGGLPEKLKMLCRKAGIENIDFNGKFTAIKMHFGEEGKLSYLRPDFAKCCNQ